MLDLLLRNSRNFYNLSKELQATTNKNRKCKEQITNHSCEQLITAAQFNRWAQYGSTSMISPEDFEDTISQWSSFDSIITEMENLHNVFNHRKLIYRQTPARVFNGLLQNRFRVKPGMTVTKYLVSRPLPLCSQ